LRKAIELDLNSCGCN